MMPSIDGLTVIRILQSMNPHVKIIATSGLISNNKLALAAGIAVKAFYSEGTVSYHSSGLKYTIKVLGLSLTKEKGKFHLGR